MTNSMCYSFFSCLFCVSEFSPPIFGSRPHVDEGPIAPIFVTKHEPTQSAAPSRPSGASSAGSGPDRRLARLQERPRERGERRYHEAEVIDAEPEVVESRRPRRPVEAAVIDENTPAAVVADAQPEEDHENRRARIKAQRQAEEAAEAAKKAAEKLEADEAGSGEESEEDEEDEEDDSSDDESSEDSGPGRVMIKPTFVRKEDRRTVQEREEAVKQEEQKKLEEEKRLEEKQQQTKELANTLIQAELQPEENSDDDIETDDENEEQTEAEYNAWKIRELKRIRRDHAERLTEEEQQKEIERRRNMTDAEIMAENRADPSKRKQPRKKMQFMQKYYHTGAFFQEEMKEIEETHDFQAPTGEDSYFDKGKGPSVLQVRNFGRGSRSKYTHLADQDTTLKSDNPWNSSQEVGKKMKTKLGGLKDQGFERPSKIRKLD